MNFVPLVLRDGFLRLIEPVAARLVRSQINPNTITTVGTAVLVGAAAAFGVGWVQLGGGLLLFSGVCDILDGKVARGGGMATKFGAFYDSTLDRVGESALFLGIAVFFLTTPGLAWPVAGAVVAVVALAGSLIVSYARARAEGLGLECKVGIGQRAERILGLGVPMVFFGAGPRGQLLLAIVVLLAAVSVVTVVQRVRYVYRLTAPATARTPRKTRAQRAVLFDHSHKGQST